MIPSVPRTLVVVLFMAACTSTGTPVIHENRQSPAEELAPDEAVAVVGLLSGVGDQAANCVGRSIRELETSFKVVPPAKFRDGMFPWFEPGTMPTTVDSLTKLMGRPAVKRQVDDFGVRYVVAVGGEISGGVGSWGGGIGGMGAGVFIGGVLYGESARLAAMILDLKQARPVGDVSASSSGAGGAGLLLLIPYFVSAPDTEQITCDAIAKRVIRFLKGEPHPPYQ